MLIEVSDNFKRSKDCSQNNPYRKSSKDFGKESRNKSSQLESSRRNNKNKPEASLSI